MNKNRAKPEAPAVTAGNYAGLLTDINQRIRVAQVRTAMAGNASMLTLYWEIGGVLAERQKREGWGSAVRPRLAVHLHNDLPEVKGFSARKMNFYLNAVDDRLKHATDQPSIGLILCEDKNKVVAEYALRGMDKAIGVSAYQLTRALPKKLQSALPSIAMLVKELSQTKHSKPTAAAPKERKSK